MMQLEYFCHVLGFGAREEAILRPHFPAAEASLPDTIEFLTPAFIEEFYPLLAWEDSTLKDMLLETAGQIAQSPCLKLYAWLLHESHFIRMDVGELGAMPPAAILGDRAGLLHLLVAMSSFPLIRQTLDRLAIPQKHLDGVANWVKGTIGIYAAAHHGMPGHAIQQTSWMRLYIQGKLFRVGRFEYLIHETPDWLPAIYRNRLTGRVVALCRDGWKFDAEGLMAASGQEVFTARLGRMEGKVVGTPISPEGRAHVKRQVVLEQELWKPVITPWEWIPSIHIPGGGGMKPELALASLKEAKEFFRRYFQRDITMFCCGSWILNPDWERELPESNLTKFRKLLYCFTATAPLGTDGLFFVFGRSQQDWSDFPEDNSLRRAFHRLRRAGRMLRSGAGFVLTEDLDHLEENYYRLHAGWQD